MFFKNKESINRVLDLHPRQDLYYYKHLKRNWKGPGFYYLKEINEEDNWDLYNNPKWIREGDQIDDLKLYYEKEFENERLKNERLKNEMKMKIKKKKKFEKKHYYDEWINYFFPRKKRFLTKDELKYKRFNEYYHLY